MKKDENGFSTVDINCTKKDEKIIDRKSKFVRSYCTKKTEKPDRLCVWYALRKHVVRVNNVRKKTKIYDRL